MNDHSSQKFHISLKDEVDKEDLEYLRAPFEFSPAGSLTESQADLVISSATASIRSGTVSPTQDHLNYSNSTVIAHKPALSRASASNLTAALRSSSVSYGSSSLLSPGPLTSESALSYSVGFLNSIQYPSVLVNAADLSVSYFNDAAVAFFGYDIDDEINLKDIFPGIKKKMRSKYSPVSPIEGPRSVPMSLFQMRRSSAPTTTPMNERKKVVVSYKDKGSGSSGSSLLSCILRAKLAGGAFTWVELSLSEWNPSYFVEVAKDRYFLATIRPLSQISPVSRYKSEFEEIQVIGKGGHGIVYKARNKLDGEEYAIKKVGLNTSSKHKRSEGLIREAQAFAKISNHPNVVRYYAAWTEPVDGIQEEEDEAESSVETTSSSDFDSENTDDSVDSLLSNDFGFSNSVAEQMKFLSTDEKSKLPPKPKKKTAANEILYIQMQLCTYKDLRKWIQNRGDAVDVDDSLKIFRQIVSAVAHIHDKKFIHGDIKPENIFVQDDHIYLGDFGLSRSAASKLAEVGGSFASSEYSDGSSHEGTYLYTAINDKISMKGDIFALGVILVELLIPFSTSMERAIVLSKIRQGILPEKDLEKFSREAQLIRSLLNTQTKKRPSADEVLATLDSWTAKNADCLIISTSPSVLNSSFIENVSAYSECMMCCGSRYSGMKEHKCSTVTSSSYSNVMGAVPVSFATPLPSPMEEKPQSKHFQEQDGRVNYLEKEVSSLRSEVERLRAILAEKERKELKTKAVPLEKRNSGNTSLRSSERLQLF
ncbi:hypothetical protein MP638_002456 [Amoeboaphelidium occidentale]|nr:hypothetical protein MP638_002456 [Amoeboaphelidium occidentale]